jgi:hypothetical protein
MRISIVLSLLGLSFVTLSQALAQEPGSIGTVECREVQLQIQLQIQNTVEMEGPYKNHGQLVKTVVHALKSAKKTKLITGKCASCIFTQFVLRIPIEEQKACGLDIESFDTIETVACCLMNDDCVDMIPEDCEAERGSKPMSSGSNCETVDCASAY